MALIACEISMAMHLVCTFTRNACSMFSLTHFSRCQFFRQQKKHKILTTTIVTMQQHTFPIFIISCNILSLKLQLCCLLQIF